MTPRDELEPRAGDDAEDRPAGDAASRSEPHAALRLLCTLSVPRALEERLVDWLLGRDAAQTFTARPAELHGRPPDELRGGDRVSGRQRRIEFQLLIAAADADALIAALDEEFGGADVEYWAVPVAAVGSLR